MLRQERHNNLAAQMATKVVPRSIQCKQTNEELSGGMQQAEKMELCLYAVLSQVRQYVDAPVVQADIAAVIVAPCDPKRSNPPLSKGKRRPQSRACLSAPASCAKICF